MVDCLLDTNIIVDLLRGHKPAQEWIATQQQPGISRAVWLEVLQGAQDGKAQRLIIKLLNEFDLVEFALSDFEGATKQLIRHNLSNSVHAFDCLIAAPCQRLQLPLYTQNLKHFVPLLGGLAQKAY